MAEETAIIEGDVHTLRRGPVQGQAVRFLSVDGSGLSVRVPTDIDESLGGPGQIVVLLGIEVEEDTDAIDEALAAEEQGEAQGVADALAQVTADGVASEEE